MTSIVSPVLQSRQTPDGWDLAKLCFQLQYELRLEYAKVSQDKRPEVRRIMRNSLQIVGLMEQAEALALDSADILDQLGTSDPIVAVLRPYPETAEQKEDSDV